MSKTPPSARARKPALNQKNVAKTAQPTSDEPIATTPDPSRQAMIAEAAYYRAERRGFAPGFELDDWLLSESELSAPESAHIQQLRLRQSTSSSSELH